jgi:DNA-binding response OmpR family regulator
MSSEKPRILIVEDEPFIAMMLEEYVFDSGCEVADIAHDLRNALTSAATGDVDIAILDISLGADSSFPVADVLANRQIPFVFASGFGASSLPEHHRGRPVLNKPYQYQELLKVLEAALGDKLLSTEHS